MADKAVEIEEVIDLGAVPDRLAEYVDLWAERGVRAWTEGWWALPGAVGDEIAPLLGADAGELVMMPNVTMAQATVLSAVTYRPPPRRQGLRTYFQVR